MTVLLRFLMAIFICTLDITAINIRVWFNNVNLSCIVKKFCVIVILYSLVAGFRWDYGTRNHLIIFTTWLYLATAPTTVIDMNVSYSGTRGPTTIS